MQPPGFLSFQHPACCCCAPEGGAHAVKAAACRPVCRVGTPTADVPAKVGDRVTVVCAPQQRSSPLAQRRLLGTAPHGTKPGAGVCGQAWG